MTTVHEVGHSQRSHVTKRLLRRADLPEALLAEKPLPKRFHPRMVAAALSAAVTTRKQQESAPNAQAELPMQKQPTQSPAALREGARGRRLLSEKPPPPAYSFPRTVAAALSAAVTTRKQQESAPNAQAELPMQKQPTQTPAALRERGSGGEGLLSEKPPLPQHLPIPQSLPRRHSSSFFPNNAFVKDLASKGWRSSMPSPTPMYQTGTFNS